MERGASVGVVEGRGAAGADRGDLFLLAEGATPAGNDLAGHLVSSAERGWKTLDLSLTGALLRLFEDAQRSLREWNGRSIPQHRAELGLSCLALRGDRAVLALRGPARVLHASGATIASHEPEGEGAAPMDGAGPAPPRLVSLPVAPGDRLLLATTNVGETLPEGVLGAILTLPLPEILPDLYRRLTHLRDAAVLLVALPAGDEPATPAPESAPEAFDAAAADGPVIGAGGAAADSPDGFQSSLFVDPGAGSASVELARRRLQALDARSRVEAAPPQDAGIGAAEARLSVPEFPDFPEANAAGGNGDAFFPALAPSRQPPAPESHRTGTAPVSELAAGRRGQLAAANGWRPPAPPGPAPPGAGGAPLVHVREAMGGGPWRGGGTLTGSGRRAFALPSWLVVLAGLALLAGIAVWIVAPRALERDAAGAAALATLLDEAQAAIAAASALDDAGARREALTRARVLLLEAEALEGGGAAIAPLLPRVERGLAELDAVVAPAAIETIADLRGFGEAPIAVARLAAGDTHVWLLDEAARRVIAVSLATGAKEVVFAAGEDGAGAPAAIAFAGDSRPGGPALLIADANGALWARTAETLERLAFARPEGLAVTDLRFADGALYVLDAPAAAVHRFAATADGFGAAPTVALRAPELADARRLTVDGDDIFTVAGDGAARRFSGELTLELSQAGIDRPLRAAARPWTDGPAGELAFLDASADRIVVLGRDGAFRRQYRHEDLRGLTAFAARAGYGYAFSGEQLRRITF